MFLQLSHPSFRFTVQLIIETLTIETDFRRPLFHPEEKLQIWKTTLSSFILFAYVLK